MFHPSNGRHLYDVAEPHDATARSQLTIPVTPILIQSAEEECVRRCAGVAPEQHAALRTLVLSEFGLV